MTKLWNLTIQFTFLDNYLGNCVIISSYTSSYIIPKLIMDFVLEITYPKPSSTCHD